jgi:hypothetical protein
MGFRSMLRYGSRPTEPDASARPGWIWSSAITAWVAILQPFVLRRTRLPAPGPGLRGAAGKQSRARADVSESARQARRRVRSRRRVPAGLARPGSTFPSRLALSVTDAPCGSVIWTTREYGTSTGPLTTVPPNSLVRAATESASATESVTLQWASSSDGIGCSQPTASVNPGGAPAAAWRSRMPG